MSTLALVLSLAAAVLAAHTVLFSAAASWNLKQTRLWRLDPNAARHMRENPPWYIRYTEWFP